MKIKYFLRGLGIGILSATILLFCIYSYKMSDSKIVEKARELGMEYTKENESETGYIKTTKDTSGSTTEISSTTETSSTKKEETTTLPQPTSSPQLIDVNISSGMNSESVSDALEAAGVINNAENFNQYLIQNNLGRYIKSGEYHLRSGMSYEEIAGILRKGR